MVNSRPRVGTPEGVLAAGLAGLLLAACSASAPPTPGGRPPSPGATGGVPTTPASGTVPPPVTALAQRFAEQTAHGDFAAQWTELAPQAQALWPSSSGRSAMLTAKFSSAPITSIDVGTPVSGVIWYDPESPAISVGGTWRFPLTVSFADPQSLDPPGVAQLFSMTALSLSYDPATRTAQVVGEGPAGIDAPVIVPGRVPKRTVTVPLFMYHLIENQTPAPSAYGKNTYGWQIDVGLTTLTSQFQAEMAYAHSFGATSISLQHLADALLYGLPLPPHAFVVTFDDGRLSQWENAVPVLRRYGFTAVFFPCTALVGGDYGPQHYMTSAQLQNLAATGFSFGDHTLKDQVALWYASQAELDSLTEQSKSVLANLVDQPIQFIAYSGPWPTSWPQAGPGPAAETALFATLHGFGYIGGLQDLRFDTATDVSTELWQLPRVRVGLGVTTAGWGHWLQVAD
jgi:peptidoglycan/xylan/chitin deacetylase (PgdA/CDA1 family)